MQNLTARFNILYNAQILLDEAQYSIESSHFEDYSQPISVYREPSLHSTKSVHALLDSVIKKANNIVNEKSSSYYVDDAFFLIAKANYLKTNYFNAAEFFDYVYKTYPEEYELRQASLVGKARAQLQLGNISEAEKTLDAALKYINIEKKSVADIYATKAQLYITTQREDAAIEMLEKAIENKSSKSNKIRWRFILAQLQEKKGELQKAYLHYKAVSSSNASFELAFNAHVNRISIEDELNGSNVNYAFKLQALLKDDKNKDFADQIFYRIGEFHRSKNQLKDALENYNKAISLSTNNPSQKGLAYLRIADLHFHGANYAKAKLYYDSTLNALPPSYPDYEQIAKKSNNLDLLADKLQTIAREERLQSLARLPEAERADLIQNTTLSLTAATNEQPYSDTRIANAPSKVNDLEGKFYFDNSSALSQGFSGFKKRWGNRQLEDNWRRSEKAATADAKSLTSNHSNKASGESPLPDANDNPNGVDDLPLTGLQIEQSNKKIMKALNDIATFYKDELEDYEQAIKTFENLLSRFPNNANAVAINYNLYRLHQSINSSKADHYKEIILTRYPESSFAKAITDPEFVNKTNNIEASLNRIYNDVYEAFLQKKHQLVIDQIKQVEKQFGNNELSPQFTYLNALSIGKTQKLPGFENALESIVKAFPEDELITPLVKQHLGYIAVNRDQLNSRPTALVDINSGEKEFFEEDNTQINSAKSNIPVSPTKVEVPSELSITASEGKMAQDPSSLEMDSPAPALFSLPDSAEYYFVLNISDPVVNLSSSRFGIGHFNRTKFQDKAIKHQLIGVNNENQLIFVGSFSSRDAVNDYESRISSLLREIMKIPTEKYNTFVITKEGLDQLKSSILIESYLDFYKNSK